MNILIDFTQIPKQKLGVGVYALNLVRQIAKLDLANSYYILMQDDEHSLDSLERNNFKLINIQSKIFRIVIFRLLLEQLLIPYITVRKRIDVVHSLHYSFPLLTFGAKKIVTIHDMTFFKFPKYHRVVKRYYFKFFTRLVARLADKIVSPSESTLKDFILWTGAKKEKVSVVHLGGWDWPMPSFPRERTELIKNKYGINGEYLLFIGMIEPRKNVANLILAFNKFLKVNNSYHLVIVGNKGWGYRQVFNLIDELKLHDKIIFTGFVEEDEKPYIIRGAKIFVYPSIYEGFGIPVLEALSLGVPTITSNVSSMPEVAGGAALLVDPTNVDELLSGIRRLLDDETLYQGLKKKAILQARKFSWRKTAQKTIELYRCVGVGR